MRRLLGTYHLAEALAGLLLLGAPAFARAEVLFSFGHSVEDWRGYEGKIEWVSKPAADTAGALEAEVKLTGKGWSDNTVESPELDRDFSGFGEFTVHVFAPSGAPPATLKAQLFAKSGPNWTWRDSGWLPLPRDRWTEIKLPIQQLADPTNVRVLGVKIGSNDQFTGSVFIDLVEASGRSASGTQSNISVTITDIIDNARIRGKVMGIPAGKVDAYKVVVYVKTDKWYIHPYERGGDGLSFASIKPDGSWQIQTVKRQFAADRVAALVVPRDYAPKTPVDTLKSIDSVASDEEEGRGRL